MLPKHTSASGLSTQPLLGARVCAARPTSAAHHAEQPPHPCALRVRQDNVTWCSHSGRPTHPGPRPCSAPRMDALPAAPGPRDRLIVNRTELTPQMCSEQIPFPRALAVPRFSNGRVTRTRKHTRALRLNGKLNLFPLGKQFQSSPGPGRGVNMSNSNIQVSPTDSGVWLREIIRETLNTQSLKRLREKLADSLHDNYCIYSDASQGVQIYRRAYRRWALRENVSSWLAESPQ